MIRVDCEIPEGFVALRYGSPMALDVYMTPNGEVKTAYYNIHGNYLILGDIPQNVEQYQGMHNQPELVHGGVSCH